MKRIPIALLLSLFLISTGAAHAQVSGNVGFGETGRPSTATQREHAKHVIAKDDHPPSATSMFVEANVLMNVRADRYVAVFAIAHEGATLDECSRKMDTALKTFMTDIQAMGIAADDVFVDFIAQNKIYAFDVTGNIAKEKLAGFELKKNVLVRYTDPALVDKLTAAAARSSIFDLVKVDYIVKDLNKVEDRLTEEAARVLKQKAVALSKATGHHAGSAHADLRRAIRDPLPNGVIQRVHRRRIRVDIERSLPPKLHDPARRKSRTFYFNGLSGDGFDDVIGPASQRTGRSVHALSEGQVRGRADQVEVMVSIGPDDCDRPRARRTIAAQRSLNFVRRLDQCVRRVSGPIAFEEQLRADHTRSVKNKSTRVRHALAPCHERPCCGCDRPQSSCFPGRRAEGSRFSCGRRKSSGSLYRHS